MHRCSSAHGNYNGPCSCGSYYHNQPTTTTPFSMLFSVPPSSYDPPFDYSYPSSSSVDCTLSLGTPSTRLSNDVGPGKSVRSSNSYMPNFCWDILQPKHHHSPSPSAYKSGRSGSGTGNGSSGGDPLVARRCANCDTTSTPLWRNGPRGPKSLCNACGIRYKKEERRASAAASTSSSNGGQGGGMMEWSHHSQTSSSSQKMACMNQSSFGNEFLFMEDDSRDFLSWRLNVTDRPSLVHDFTR